MNGNWLCHLGGMVLAGAILCGCATPAGGPPKAGLGEPVWPPPPAPARVVYERSITGPADIGIRDSWWQGLVGFFTGDGGRTPLLVRPFGLACDEQGNLCLTDPGAGRVWYFDRRARRARNWSKIGAVPLVSPVAVAKRKAVFYVADSGLQQVLAFDPRGQLRFRIGPDQLERPAGLVIIGDELFVADAGAHCVVVFDLAGRFLRRLGTRGLAAGEFNFPTHLATDGARLYVTDSMNDRVQVLDRQGRLEQVIGNLGDGSGYFSRPKATALDRHGHVYVTDAVFDNIQIFDQQGRFLLAVGGAGSGPGEFWMPAGVAISRDDEIFVADSYNRRVQVFRYVGGP